MVDVGHKVMVVDDEKGVLEFMERTLRSGGYDVVVATGFQKALEVIGNKKVDILVSDIVMPDGSGLDLGRIAKTRYPNIKLAIMTGYHSEGYALESVRVGADYYLRKPFTKEDVLDMVANLGQALMACSKVELVEARSGWYEFVITSSEDSLFKLQCFLDALLKDILDEERFWDLHFAISELGKNAIEWGNRYDVSSVVSISVGITRNGITVKIEDEGSGFDVRAAMDKVEETTLDSLEEDRLSQGKRAGGLGLHLIREIADRLIFSDKGNVVLFHLGLQKQRGTSNL